MKTKEIPMYTMRKLSDNQWIVNSVTDEPLTRHQLLKLSVNTFDIATEELAFMFMDMKENPSYTKAYFGFNRTYLYSD